jgi:hypothetical protein
VEKSLIPNVFNVLFMVGFMMERQEFALVNEIYNVDFDGKPM